MYILRHSCLAKLSQYITISPFYFWWVFHLWCHCKEKYRNPHSNSRIPQSQCLNVTVVLFICCFEYWRATSIFDENKAGMYYGIRHRYWTVSHAWARITDQCILWNTNKSECSLPWHAEWQALYITSCFVYPDQEGIKHSYWFSRFLPWLEGQLVSDSII